MRLELDIVLIQLFLFAISNFSSLISINRKTSQENTTFVKLQNHSYCGCFSANFPKIFRIFIPQNAPVKNARISFLEED